MVRSGRGRPKPEGIVRCYVSVLEALPAWEIVGFMAEVDARGPHRSEALARSEADLSHQAESVETLPLHGQGSGLHDVARRCRKV